VSPAFACSRPASPTERLGGIHRGTLVSRMNWPDRVAYPGRQSRAPGGPSHYATGIDTRRRGYLQPERISQP